MVSHIDVTKPTEGKAYTQDVRNNFSIIKTEIESIQLEYLSLSGGIVTGSTTFDSGLEVRTSHGTTILNIIDSEEDTSGIPRKIPHPDTLLMLNGRATGPNTNIEFVTYSGANIIRGYAAENTGGGTIGAVGLSRNLMIINGGGYDGAAWQGGRAAMWITASEVWTPTANGTQISWRTTLNGQNTQQDSMLLSNAGNLVIGSTVDTGQRLQVNGNGILTGTLEVIGETDWGDFDTVNFTVGGNTFKSGMLFADRNDIAFGFTLENGQFYVSSGTKSGGSTKPFLRFTSSGFSVQSAATFSGLTTDKIDFRTGYICMVSLPNVAQGDTTRVWNHGGVLNIGAGATLVTIEHLDDLNQKIEMLTKRIALLESHFPPGAN